MEEFQESDIIFRQNVETGDESDDGCGFSGQLNSRIQESDVISRRNVDQSDVACGSSGQLNSRVSRNFTKQKTGRRKGQRNSVPINIPGYYSGHPRGQSCVDSDFFDEDGELVPPHVIVGRRMSDGKVAFSVSSGRGRTLKGRELRQVRNSILKLTGFLET